MSGAGGVPFWNDIGPEGGPLLAGTPEKTGFISMMRLNVQQEARKKVKSKMLQS
jgi:hypothetical protein